MGNCSHYPTAVLFLNNRFTRLCIVQNPLVGYLARYSTSGFWVTSTVLANNYYANAINDCWSGKTVKGCLVTETKDGEGTSELNNDNAWCTWIRLPRETKKRGGYSQVTLPYVLFNLMKIMGELLGIYSRTTSHICNKISLTYSYTCSLHGFTCYLNRYN